MLKNQFLVTLSRNGKDYGKFDSFTGGKGTTNTARYREGGEAEKKPIGGTKDREPITSTRRYKFERDHPIFKELDRLRGTDGWSILKHPLDADMNVIGEPIPFTGVLEGVEGPDSDSNSDGEVAMLSLEFSAGPIG